MHIFGLLNTRLLDEESESAYHVMQSPFLMTSRSGKNITKMAVNCSKNKFAVMRWLNDNNKLAVHDQKHILEPEKSVYKPGDEGYARFPGFPGRWKFRILAVGGKKQMKEWLDTNFNMLMVDVTDGTLPDSTAGDGVLHNLTDGALPDATDATYKLQDGLQLNDKKFCSSDYNPGVIQGDTASVSTRAEEPVHSHSTASASPSLPSATLTSKQVAEKALLHTKKTKSSHSECVTRKEFRELKDEVKQLKRQLSQELEARDSTFSPTRESTPKIPPSPAQIFTKETCSPVQSSLQCTAGTFNGFTLDDLWDSVSHLDKLYEAIKVLMLKPFTRQYILSHSVSGKAPNSKTLSKPAFDSKLFSAMITVLKEKFNASNKDIITEKVHSVQKYVANHNN